MEESRKRKGRRVFIISTRGSKDLKRVIYKRLVKEIKKKKNAKNNITLITKVGCRRIKCQAHNR